MIGIFLVALVAGVIAGISPCILPVLPVVLVGGGTAPSGDAEGGARAGRRRRPVAVIAGLVVSFTVFTLAGAALLSTLGLPLDWLRDAGIIVLVAIGLGLMVPRLGEWIERPFARLRVPTVPSTWGGFVLGLALGVVFVPCAGPVLAAISVVAATHRVGVESVVVTCLFAIGAALPLLVVALAGAGLTGRVRALSQRVRGVRTVGGAILIAVALAMAGNLTDGLQTALPTYTNALQQALEATPFAQGQLAALVGRGRAPAADAPASDGVLTDCEENAPDLAQCGPAPNFAGISAWINTPGGRPLTVNGLRGKVVLVDFWTYSCINCQRALPHVEAWYKRYAKDSFVVVGVHTPEFAFEHVVSNVQAATARLGVTYPVAVDDAYDTWNAYENEAWPADYLIDANGVLRHIGFGEGNYGGTETLIRDLLRKANPKVRLPRRTDVPNLTPTAATTPESYLGYDRLDNLSGAAPDDNKVHSYAMPPSVPVNAVGLSGTWTIHDEEMTAGLAARLVLHFSAKDVYLVLGGKGTVRIEVGGGPARTVTVSGIPRLYTMVHGATMRQALLRLDVSRGVEAYDFTFG